MTQKCAKVPMCINTLARGAEQWLEFLGCVTKERGSTETRRVDLDQRRRTRKISKTIFQFLEDTKSFEIEEKGD